MIRKKRNLKTIKTEETIINITNEYNDNDINNDIDNNIYNKNDNDINDNKEYNINTLMNNEKNKRGLNNLKNKKPFFSPTQIAGQQRKKLFDSLPQKNKDNVIKCILKELPELNMQPQRIIQYLRLLYISNQKHIAALEKIQNNQPLSQRDVLPVDDSIEIKAIHYPPSIETMEIDQILSDEQSRFLNNIRNGIDKKQAFLDAGYSPSMTMQLLPIITNTNPDKFEYAQYKNYKKVWVEYWKIKKEQSEATGITEDYILSGLKKTADFNIKKLFDHNGNLKNINDLDNETAKQVQEIKVSETKITNNKTKQTTTRTTTLSIKVGNKDTARKELAKLQQGIFNHVNTKTIQHNVSGSVSHGVLDVSKLSNDQLNKILMINQDNNQLLLDTDCYNEEIIDAEIINNPS